jgi:hypothetical protein
MMSHHDDRASIVVSLTSHIRLTVAFSLAVHILRMCNHVTEWVCCRLTCPVATFLCVILTACFNALMGLSSWAQGAG